MATDLVAACRACTPIPFPNSSVPGEPDQALRYAKKLEDRWKADQDRMRAAVADLDIANEALLQALTTPKRVSRMALATALGKVQTARESLGW